jgi:hypothetical protein
MKAMNLTPFKEFLHGWQTPGLSDDLVLRPRPALGTPMDEGIIKRESRGQVEALPLNHCEGGGLGGSWIQSLLCHLLIHDLG